jgi:outer membrane protein assembly factor BamB
VIRITSGPFVRARITLGGRALPAKAELGPDLSGSILYETRPVSSVDPESGRRLWERPDASDYEHAREYECVVATVGGTRVVLDLESGRERWSLTALGFTKHKGLFTVPERRLLLAFGETPTSPLSLVAATIDSGAVVWRQDDLYSAGDLRERGRKTKSLAERQPVLLNGDAIVLNPSHDGLLRLDLGTGRLLWRMPEAEIAEIGAAWEGYSPMIAADGSIYVAYDKKVLAIDAVNGRIQWNRNGDFRSRVAQMEVTPRGLVVRGGMEKSVMKKNMAWRPFLALLDAKTGSTVWTTETQDFDGRSAFLVQGDRVVIALREGLTAFDLATGQVQTTTSRSRFEGGEEPCCIEPLGEERYLLLSSQNLQVVDLQEAKTVYHAHFKAPGSSLLTKIGAVALLAAATAGGAAASPNGIVVPTGSTNALLTAKFKATTDADRYRYLFTEAPDAAGREGFSVVRVDKETGKETGRIWTEDRHPDYVVEPITGTVVMAADRKLTAHRF